MDYEGIELKHSVIPAEMGWIQISKSNVKWKLLLRIMKRDDMGELHGLFPQNVNPENCKDVRLSRNEFCICILLHSAKIAQEMVVNKYTDLF